MSASASTEEFHDAGSQLRCEHRHCSGHIKDWDSNHHHHDENYGSSWNGMDSVGCCGVGGESCDMQPITSSMEEDEELEALLVVRDRGKGGTAGAVTTTNLEQQVDDGVVV